MRKLLISAALTLTMICGVTASSTTILTGKNESINQKVEEKISTMTLEEKVGQMMFYGVNGTNVDDKVVNLFEDQHAGGIILYGYRNFWGSSLDNNVKYVNSIKKANRQNSDIPLFIGFDEEGGSMSQLPQELMRTPSKGELGNTNDSSLASGIGAGTAKKLKLLGINTDFGTVLDINTNKNNPIIGVRSYGSTKEKVTEFGINELKAIQNEGVIPTVKHFPGHGDTEVDSHLGLPSLNHDLNRLKSTELVPFQAAIDNGVDMVMTAHIMLPQIDKEYPATMSKKILTDLLRDEMGYKGVIITDDLEMQAISKNWDLGEAAIKSVEAGVDILLVCHTIENQQKVYNAVVQGVNDGKIDENRIDESVRRILRLKYQYKLSDKANNPTEDDINNVNGFIYESIQKYNSKVVEAMYK
ncbi:glycoside hydrolase family 3 protein [Clostridium paraputrificum]|uniref:glycoside hydrolase family 3 protein n=1 Tax=Clostridium paraputrificum TaxID=29363 RepID=UPI00232A8A53|nr:glycoside hydrolase family 3 protein [Clostridium paraputrificum]MDB2102550.1 glycoside hydrolase family 3 protein [Clostridium paraputrificum]